MDHETLAFFWIVWQIGSASTFSAAMRWRPSISWENFQGRLMKLCRKWWCPDGPKKNLRKHPGRLTWNLKMMVWKMIFLFNWVIFRFHVVLPGCTGIFWFRNPAGDSLQSWCLGDTWKDSWQLVFLEGVLCWSSCLYVSMWKIKWDCQAITNSNSRIKWYQMKKTYIDKASPDFPPRNKRRLCSRCYVSLWSKGDEPM